MSEKKLPELGKIPYGFFDRVIYPKLGAASEDVIIGPQHGVDFGVIRVGGLCLAFSTDPFFIVPSFGFARAAWFAFHIVFCDVAVSGLTPRYLTIDLNLPPEMRESELEEMWDSIHAEAVKYGVSVITGHTARYTGCTYPMVGGATSIAVGGKRDLRGPKRVRSGDRIVITKGPAVETTGLLAVLFPEKFIAAGGESFQKEAAEVFSQMTVMEDCAVARKLSGVHVMHDATECGVWGGLYEMARAGGYGLRVEEEAIPLQPVIRKTAELFRFDPFSAISEGTLIACVDKKDAEGLIRALRDQGITAAVAGQVMNAEEGMKIIGRAGARDLEHPSIDPYWVLAAEFSK
jgi:hydrogenase expression/formation protein HypE